MTGASRRILALAGGDLAAPLLDLAASAAAAAGSAVTKLDLCALQLPLFGGGSGSPIYLDRFVESLDGHVGILIAAPDVVGAPAPVLTNALAWLQSVRPGAALAGKVVALMAPAPSGSVGVRSLSQARAIMAGLGALVLPYPVAVQSGQLQDGQVTDPVVASHLRTLGTQLAEILARLDRA